MPRPIRTIEIYLPIEDNDGTPVESKKLETVQDDVLDRFGGVTITQRKFPLHGFWRSGSQTFQDKVIILTVMDFSDRTEFQTIRYLQSLKARLKNQFDQLDILITLQHLLAI